jgi:hypothetical protein
LSASSLFSEEGRTSHFHKIVRTRLKMKDLIFALWKKSKARVRKVLKGKGILFRWCARAERTALGNETSISFVAERCVGTLGDGENGSTGCQRGWLDVSGEAVLGADGAKINWEHKLL